MDWIQAVILGIIQGLTEFLPVSSSGHLVLAQSLLGLDEPGLLLEVILHLGTLTAILFYYYPDLNELLRNFLNGKKESRTYCFQIAIATLPVAIVGFFCSDLIETTFTPSVVKWTLIITGIVLISTYFSKFSLSRELTSATALLIGFAQVFAIIPGISRSGFTIACALILGIKRDFAAKFAFFMAIPVLIGAGIQQIPEIGNYHAISLLPLLIGYISSALTGYLVIGWLLAVISKGRFWLFSLYCFCISFLAFIYIN